MTTPTTSNTASAAIELTTEQREQLEVIASTYHWNTYAYRHDPIHKMLLDMCPGVDYFMPKILDNLIEKGLICYPDKNRPYDYIIRNKKNLKAHLKRNINRFKAFKYPVINEHADDSHGLTTDDGDVCSTTRIM